MVMLSKLAMMMMAFAAVGIHAEPQWKFDPVTGKKLKKGPPVASVEKQREDAVWGRLYLDGAVDGRQYLKGSFGEKSVPSGLHEIVLADPINACEPPATESGSLYSGKFVLVRRGDCTFEAKALNLNALGASAMIVGNNDGGIVHMPGSQNLDIDIASVMVNNYTAAYLETLVIEKRGSSTDGSISSALVPISCGTKEDLFKLNLIYKLDGESDQEYQCLTPVEDERKFMNVVEGGALRFGNSEIEYLTASFGGPSLGKQYPFYVAGNACGTEDLEKVAGKIAVVNRGDCELLKKAESVQEAGGIAMVLVNDGPGLSRIATSSQWESAHVVIHTVMASKSSGEKLIAAIEADPKLMGEFQGGRVHESDWKEVVDLMNLDNWPTSKRKGKALYASMKEIHAGNPDRLACLEAGWQAFKDDHGIKEEL